MEKIRVVVLFLLAVALAGCAGQYPPTGGPIDTTPPEIDITSPTQNELNYTSREIRIRFDKYMVRRTVESSIFFPPFDLNELKFDWSGKELTISVEKPLEKDRTYILTVGARAQGEHGNYLGKAYNIVFSTGAQIDTGTVSGEVYSPKAQSYTIAAYPVTPDIDTLRPYVTLPRYITQSDDSGSYVLQGLAAGSYRLICFDDQMRNFLYAPQLDLYSSATHDIKITSSDQKVSNVDFIVAREDTSRPQLYGASLANDGFLLLKFSEPLDTSYLSPSYFSVRDSATGTILPVDFAARLESNEYDAVIHISKPLSLHRKYYVIAKDSLRDMHSNFMSDSNSTVLIEPDSVSAKLGLYYFNFPDSLKKVTAYDTLLCQFLAPSVNGVQSSPELSVLDTTGTPVTDGVSMASQTVFSLNLHRLAPSRWYTARLEFKIDSGGVAKDSVVERSFMTVDSSSLGDIVGRVTPVVPGKRVVVAAHKEGGNTCYAFADSNGTFHMGGILAGNYDVRAYVQHGRGMAYYNGRSFPYRFAKPLGVYPEQLKIRARWTTEGVDIRLH